MTRLGTFDELMAGVPAELAALAWQLRTAILEVHPQAVEVVRLGDNAASFGVGPKKMSEAYCYVMPQRSWVNLGFYQGAALPDPQGLLEGTGKRLRHVKLHAPAAVAQPAVRALIAAALAERRAALGLA
ncbi:MAG: DUF1801 domain-containing protein [Anaerolineales bacterium]|nr:DUF1801 domain-containing protein [Anaerolineales bacterium]